MSGTSLQNDLDRLTATIRNLATSIELAQRSGNTAAVEGLKVQYRAVSQALASLRQRANAHDMPSGFMLSLSNVSDDLTHAGASIGEGITGAVKGLGKFALIALGLVVVGAVAVAVVFTKTARPA